MVDAGSIAAAIGSLRAAADITKGFLDLKEAAAVQGKVIELQGVILAAQSSALAAHSDQLSLLEEIRSLKAQMAELEAWDAQKKRYALKNFGGDTFAYELKEAEAEGEPIHSVCPACYQKGHLSILQNQGGNYSGQQLFHCYPCKQQYFLGQRRSQSRD